MKVPSNAKIWPIALSGAKLGDHPLTRLNVRKLDSGRAVLEATDGTALVRVDVEVEEGDCLGTIPASILKDAKVDALGTRSIVLGADTVTATTKAGGTVSLKLDRRKDDYPDTPRVVPETQGQFRVTLDVDLLAKISEAFGGRYLTLCLEDTQSSAWNEGEYCAPIIILPAVVNRIGGTVAGDAVLMPCFGKRGG